MVSISLSLSPALFWCQMIDNVVYYPNHYSLYMWMARIIGCHMSFISTGIFLYADDLFLNEPSVHTLQIMLNVCETELSWLDMRICAKKSVYVRFEQRFDTVCANLITDSGDELKCVQECRYLGVYLVSARPFKCKVHFFMHLMLYLAV